MARLITMKGGRLPAEEIRSSIEGLVDADVDRVLGNLLHASENHLAALEKTANRTLPTGRPAQQGQGPAQDAGRQRHRHGADRPGQGVGEHPRQTCPRDDCRLNDG